MKRHQRAIMLDKPDVSPTSPEYINPLLHDYALLDTRISHDAEYLPLMTYFYRYRKDLLLAPLDMNVEVAKLVSACREQNAYVKHIKNPKLGIILTFPKTILDKVFFEERFNNG